MWQQVQQQQQEAQSESESGDNTDVPAAHLADKDSLFVDVNGLSVHYKQAYPAKVSSLLSYFLQSHSPMLPCHTFCRLCKGCKNGASIPCWYPLIMPCMRPMLYPSFRVACQLHALTWCLKCAFLLL